MTGNVGPVQIASSRFGPLQAVDHEVVAIDGGLLGFPDASSFLRVPVADAEGWLWLQSISDPELAFLAITAFRFFPDYDIELEDADAEVLGLDDAADAEVLALVTVRHDDDDGAISAVTANLLGPLVINARTNVGRQVVIADHHYSTREPLAG